MALNWSAEKENWPNAHASQFINSHRLNWHVQVFGNGPDLLLLHGTGSSSHSWDHLAPLLAKRFRVIALDLPGHGFTELPDRAAMTLPSMSRSISLLLSDLKAKPALVVGHSAGAAILCQMCLDGEISPKSVISINGAFLPFQHFIGQFFAPLSRVLLANPLVPGLFSTLTSRQSVGKLMRGTGSQISKSYLDGYVRLLGDPSHVRGALTMMASWDLRKLKQDVGDLDIPLYLIVGSNDQTVSPDEAEIIGACVPHSQVVRLDQLGHLAHEEAPDRVFEVITAVADHLGI